MRHTKVGLFTLNSWPQIYKCVLWSGPVQCPSLCNDPGPIRYQTYPCQSCDNQTYLLMLTSSERTKISAIEYRVGGMVGKDFLDQFEYRHSSTGSKYIIKGKYSRHLGVTFWSMWRTPGECVCYLPLLSPLLWTKVLLLWMSVFFWAIAMFLKFRCFSALKIPWSLKIR